MECLGGESEEPAKNEKGTRMSTNKVEDQKDISFGMTELTLHVRKKQKIFTQTQMLKTRVEQRPRCSDRCKGRMEIEIERGRESGKQRITRSA